MAFSVTQDVRFKLTAVLALFCLVFICSWLPGRLITFLHRDLDSTLDQQRLQQVLTGMNCFAGGVFLATCLLDLLPELREMVTGPDGPMDNDDKDDSIVYSEISQTDACTRLYGYRRKRLKLPKLSPSKDTELISSWDGERQFVHDTPLNRLRRHSSLRQTSLTDNNNNLMTKNPESIQRQKRTSLDYSAILLLLVLSIHCIFDGMTVGIESHPSPQALEVTVAVAIHKCVFAFGLGVQYAQTTKLTTGLNRSILCYSAASPVGIFTAFMFELIATNLANLQALLGSVLPAITTGILAFKIFLDISPATCQS